MLFEIENALPGGDRTSTETIYLLNPLQIKAQGFSRREYAGAGVCSGSSFPGLDAPTSRSAPTGVNVMESSNDIRLQRVNGIAKKLQSSLLRRRKDTKSDGSAEVR
jgi:hypothetical protein